MLYVQPDLHYLHYMTILFVSFMAVALIIGKISKHRKEGMRFSELVGVDTTPWKHFTKISVMAVVTMVGLYVVLSPWGLVESDRSNKNIIKLVQ